MSAQTELAEYLEDQGEGTVGTDLFWGEIPAGVTNAMCLTQYPGAPPELTCGSDGITVGIARLQLRVRNSDEATALSKAQSAANALAKIANETIESVRYRSVTVLQDPGLLFRDELDMPNFGFNLEAERDA